jgi:oxygen-dependent protoporphyrinogen oxidase
LANAPKSIAVLGAGITGLTAAHRLGQRGFRVRVFESSDRVGGAIRTERTDGWLIEGGPNSLLAGEPALTTLLDELGLAGERVAANPAAKKRFIVRRGRLVPAPMSPPALLTSSLFSLRARFLVFSELLMRSRVRTSDLSLEEFIAGHFGQEVVDYGLNPLVAGVYAGNPKKLSARYAFPRVWDYELKHGSILRGARATAAARPGAGIISFTRGLETITEALAARLPLGALALNARLEALVPGLPAAGAAQTGKPWSVIWNDGRAAQTETFDAVIAALPAAGLASLRIGTLAERPLASLDNIEHPPVSALFLGYRREQVTHPLDGFGVLMPEIEGRAALGILFSSTLFPGRAPDGHVALTVMVGGTRQPDLARLPAEKMLAAIDRDLRELLGVSGAPVFKRLNFWPRAIPQYNLGYEQHLEAMAAAERTHKGLHIGGQARDGIALPACVAAGERLAARITA